MPRFNTNNKVTIASDEFCTFFVRRDHIFEDHCTTVNNYYE